MAEAEKKDVDEVRRVPIHGPEPVAPFWLRVFKIHPPAHPS